MLKGDVKALDEAERLAVTLHEASTDQGVLRSLQRGLPLDPGLGVPPGGPKQVEVPGQGCDLEGGKPRLTAADQFSRTADLQVQFRDAETVVGADEGLESGLAVLGHGIGEQHAQARLLAAAHPPPQLVQLREPEVETPLEAVAEEPVAPDAPSILDLPRADVMSRMPAPAARDRQSDDLEIPAFLRRQAN